MTELENLKQEVQQLHREFCRMQDRAQIENLVAEYQHQYAAGMGEKIVDLLWAAEHTNISCEFGASGSYHGVRKVKTYYQKDRIPGNLNLYTMSTPCIEVASDGKTAKGLWFSIGIETDAGDLGPEPVLSPEKRRLLTSITPTGLKFKAEWVWQKIEMFFIRESVGWRIWHLHGYDIFRCPFDENWVTYAEKRFQTDGYGIEDIFTKNIPYAPDEPPENNADAPTQFHWQYTVDAVPVLYPEPPKPYTTIDTDFEWPGPPKRP